MLNHKLKESIENKFKELQMNLENNYKDLAIDARKDLEETLERLHESGELKEKYYKKYKEKLDDYTNRMIGYHHQIGIGIVI